MKVGAILPLDAKAERNMTMTGNTMTIDCLEFCFYSSAMVLFGFLMAWAQAADALGAGSMRKWLLLGAGVILAAASTLAVSWAFRQLPT